MSIKRVVNEQYGKWGCYRLDKKDEEQDVN